MFMKLTKIQSWKIALDGQDFLNEILVSNLASVKLLDQKRVWRGKSCQILFSILWYNPSLLQKYDLRDCRLHFKIIFMCTL